ncbi:MAG TPA: hypothetical protein VKA50_07050 [Gammaproteobacteria bacterium]|nr:hypothetical protein [Gammaproteobacteria bacterium]
MAKRTLIPAVACSLAALWMVFWTVPGQALEVERMHEDNVHVRTWNRFADDLLALHQRRMARREVRTEERIGGYADIPDFYREVSYFDADTGRLLSRIRWEREHPDTVHVIELYIRDAQGRVIRDYTAAFLPYYRNAPSQTLISLHRYHGDLHAFRTFDASGARIFERCQGNWQERDIDVMLDEDEIYDQEGEPGSVMESPVYKACFGDLQTTAEGYLKPH